MALIIDASVSGTPAINLAAETAILVTPGVSTRYNGDQIQIDGTLDITAGTGTTAVTIRCRRGNGVTGAIVGAAEPDTLAAGASEAVPFTFTDQPGDVAGQVYTLTVQQTGGTGNGTVNGGGCQLAVGQP